MKKILLIIFVVAVMFSFAACGNKNESENGESGAKIDFDYTTQKLEFNVQEYEASDVKIDFEYEPIEYDFNFDVVTYDSSDAVINFDFEEFKTDIADNIAEADVAKIGDFTEDQMKEIVTTKHNLLQNLEMAFNQAGLPVKINETTGEISIDSSVLFGGDSAELTTSGKELLQKFITVYTTVVFNEEFDGFISKVLVEGHTAPVSGVTYDEGMPLSIERADNVKNFCLSEGNGVPADKIKELDNVLESVGLSNSKPVVDESGNVDLAASRRVTFRFLINSDI